MSDVETYDRAKVGARVAWGRSHSVYRYGESEIIKFPRLEILLKSLLGDGLTLPERFERDIAICEKYLGDIFLSTRIVMDAKGRIATIQPYVTGRYLSKEDLKDATIKSRFEELVRRYKALQDAGYEVDLIGHGGVFRRRLSNVFVLGDGSLKLVDATIIDMKKYDSIMYAIQLLGNLILKWQYSTLRYLYS